jgi:hypothetical protein
MAQVTRVNGGVATPVTKSENQMLNGDQTMIAVNFDSVDVSAKYGVGGAIEFAVKSIANAGFNVVHIGTAVDNDATTDSVRMSLEGVFGTDTYDGTNSETVHAYLETVFDDISAAGTTTVDGVTVANITVDAFAF